MNVPAVIAGEGVDRSPLRKKIDAELVEATAAVPACQGKAAAAQQALTAAEDQLLTFRAKFRNVEDTLVRAGTHLAAPLIRHRRELELAVQAAKSTLQAAAAALETATERLEDARAADLQLRMVGE